jgi:hypothetical protein
MTGIGKRSHRMVVLKNRAGETVVPLARAQRRG